MIMLCLITVPIPLVRLIREFCPMDLDLMFTRITLIAAPFIIHSKACSQYSIKEQYFCDFKYIKTRLKSIALSLFY